MSETTTTMATKKAQPPQVQKAVKHCVFCRLDITSLLHIQCIETCCKGFEVCLHCFSLGLELDPHETTHRYKVISATTIPVFSDDWGADEELALLDAVEKCGLGNWTDIAMYVGNKSEHVCEAHYFNKYIFSPFSPLPDLTQPYPSTTRRVLESTINDHNIDISQLIFLPPHQTTDRFGATNTAYQTVLGPHGFVLGSNLLPTNPNTPNSGINNHNNNNNNTNLLQDDVGADVESTTTTTTTTIPASLNTTITSNELQQQNIKQSKAKRATMTSVPTQTMTPIQSHVTSSIPNSNGGANPTSSTTLGNMSNNNNVNNNQQASWDYEQWYRCRLRQAHFEKPQDTSRWKLQQMEFKGQMKNNLSLAVGYLPQRHDYEVEYLNDAEKDIADMDFRPDDTTIERELKLRVMELYNHVLDERIERKEFIDRYQLLVKRDRKLTREEQQVYKSLRPFARYLEAEDFDELVRSIVVERSLRLRIEQLQTYRLNGIQTLQDGIHFDQDYQTVMSEWESIHKKNWLDATTIPVGQYEALKHVLRDLDGVLGLEDDNNNTTTTTTTTNNNNNSAPSSSSSSNNNIDTGLDLDHEGRPVVQFINGYPTLSVAMAQGKNTRLPNTTPTDDNNTTKSGINPFKQNVLAKEDIPSFFSANTTTSTTTMTTTKPHSHNKSSTSTFERSIPISPQNSAVTNCPCVAAGNSAGVTGCLFNIKDYPHAQMLSQAEQLLCRELHLLPQHYLVIKDQLIKEAVQSGFITQGTARNVLKVDVHVTDRVLNFCISQNIIPITPPLMMDQ